MKRNYRYLNIAFFFPLLVLLFIIALQPVEIAKPKVVIRFDDYGVWCNKDWLNIEESVINLHQKYNVKLTYAVIPDSRYPLSRHMLSPQFYPKTVEGVGHNLYPLIEGSRRVEILKQSTASGITEVALHGYYHPKGYSNIEKNTEFYKVPYDIQYKKLHNGKNKLDTLFATNVTTFIPPHNTYDLLTLDLIDELGFKCISAKQNSYDAPIENKLKLSYLWQTEVDVPTLFSRLKNEHFTNSPAHVLALHHTNFTSDGIIDIEKLHEYELLLKSIRDSSVPNYHFSDFQPDDYSNNNLYNKYSYLAIASKIGDKAAAKFTKIGKIIGYPLLLFLLYFSLLLMIIGFVNTIVFSWESNKRVCLLSKIVFFSSMVMFLYLFIRAYLTSLYDLFYFFLSYKCLLLTVLLSTLLPLSFPKNSK